VRQAALKDKDAKFTALLHHVDVDRLRAAYLALRPKAAAGVDGVTWHEYGLDLEADLRDVHGRVHCGSYRAKPVRRAYIPKRDGRPRPLGVAALEDKIVQRAVVEVLNRSMRRTSSASPPGRPDALLRPAPLRTVRAAFTAHGSSKPLGLAGVRMLRVCAASGDVSSEGADVGETGFV
jgi:hypothetical protein